ncbi:KPN_02809 family neutral zinc metallopeptidase [Streptosporangium soli]|nr:neutral zinc metallopeptidase [Streptosporangium sp. KLBMP 9127]
MDFRDDAKLDSSQVEDAGGRGGFRRGGLAIGGGLTGIIALIAALLLGLDPGDLTGGEPAGLEPTSNLNTECRTGQDADQSEKCRVVGVVNSIQAYWAGAFAQGSYQPAKTVLFSGNVQTGCGAADSSVGPFYCPRDRRVYLDLTFFDQLQSRFGAKGGPFAQAYVIGHEYGHHVQNLVGTPREDSVRLELQADCYAGVWADNAVQTGFYTRRFTDADIEEALSAAAAVGDDRIQERTQGRIDPEAFTHGSSEQRVKWFKTGYQSGDPAACDTFSQPI